MYITFSISAILFLEGNPVTEFFKFPDAYRSKPVYAHWHSRDDADDGDENTFLLVVTEMADLTYCTSPSCLVYCADAACASMEAGQPRRRGCSQCGGETLPWDECGWLEVDQDQLWRFRYELLTALVYDDEERVITISELHARVICQAWAGADWPEMLRWANGADDCDPDVLVAESDDLTEKLCMNRDSWPHEGRADPQIAAALAMHNYLVARAETQAAASARSRALTPMDGAAAIQAVAVALLASVCVAGAFAASRTARRAIRQLPTLLRRKTGDPRRVLRAGLPRRLISTR
ncbi:hypothetical protein [Nocardia asiatica]|uniref:hypothetical protein n=1 Tax=Nocardia asiatica TaxID=209252 RepID=UPI0024573BD4|nr:hypothetical protein [Nocardia asiatica]